MDPKHLINRESGDDILEAITQLAASHDPASIDLLLEFFRTKEYGTFLKTVVPRWAALGLLQKGPQGVQALVDQLPETDSFGYRKAIIEVLWNAAHGTTSFRCDLPGSCSGLAAEIPESAKTAAVAAMHEIVLESRLKASVFEPLLLFLVNESWLSYIGKPEHEWIGDAFDLLTLGSFKLSKSLIKEFEDLVTAQLEEEAYQAFLSKHPVFLDPLASAVIPKQKLGIEFVTDFVLHRFDGKYTLVEIEKPQDRLFTSRRDFTSQFTHAFGQVLDFQQWVDSHGEYANSLMPGISSPRGCLVMGRRSELDEMEKKKLHRLSITCPHVTFKTFDDVIEDAKALYKAIAR